MLYKYFKERLSTLWAPGIKIWSNGLPLKLDLWQSCRNSCRYCFANELRDVTLGRNGIKQNPLVARLADAKGLYRFINKALKGDDNDTPFMNWALREKYFIELGTTGETFQEYDKEIKITKEFLKVASDLQLPLFINTKMNLLCTDEEYQKLLIDYKAPILLSVTFTTVKDEVAKVYEPLAPLPSARLKTLKEFSKYPHIKSAVYISPFIPSVTDEDTEEYITKIIDAGMIGGHLRDFFIQGNTFKNQFWSKYIGENKKSLEAFPGGLHVRGSLKKEFLDKAQAIATKLDPNFKIVGMKTRFFDLDTHYGKLVYDILPESFKKGIVDFTAIPILRKIKEKINEPQLLSYEKLGYKIDKIKLPKYVRSKEGAIDNLMQATCNCNKSDVELRMYGENWLTAGIWDGFDDDKPTGFISTVEGIYPVKHNNKYVKDYHFLYAFVPENRYDLLRGEKGQSALFDDSELINPYVELKDIQNCFAPSRLGGTEDKWIKN